MPPLLAPARGIAAALSGRPGADAAGELLDQIVDGLESSGVPAASAGRPTLAVLFASSHHAGRIGALLDALRKRLNPACLIGVTGEAVLGGSVEQEAAPGVSLLAAHLPGASAHAFSTEDLPLAYAAPENGGFTISSDGPDEPADPDDFARLATATGMAVDHRATILFADPFSTRVPELLPALGAAQRLAAPGAGLAPILGGIASAGSRPRGNALIINDRVLDAGVVGFTLRGSIRVDAVVSQGCLPFGPNLVITAASGNVIRTLGGKPALAALDEAIESLPEARRQLLSRGVFLGRVVNEFKTRFGRDDYLIRGVTGFSKEGGELAINDLARVGQTVRFHLRDARTADEDLGLLLDGQRLHGPPLGALLFTCNGRGRRMFAQPNHDAAAIASLFHPGEPGEVRAKGGEAIAAASPAGRPSAPVAGFFAAGEIGPVGDRAFVHGFTASAAIFREP